MCFSPALRFPQINVTSPSAFVSHPAALPPATPPGVPPTPAPPPPPVAAAPAPPATVVAVLVDHRRDADSPGTIRPFPSIAEFLQEEPSAKLCTPERVPSPPKAPAADLLNPWAAAPPLRPRSASPLESEAESEAENTRLVSMDDFLSQGQDPQYARRAPVIQFNSI